MLFGLARLSLPYHLSLLCRPYLPYRLFLLLIRKGQCVRWVPGFPGFLGYLSLLYHPYHLCHPCRLEDQWDPEDYLQIHPIEDSIVWNDDESVSQMACLYSIKKNINPELDLYLDSEDP